MPPNVTNMAGDPYAWRCVAYHLAKAGRESDLHRLLVNFDYLLGKLAATHVNALIADYDYLPKDTDLLTIQSVLRHSAHILVGSPRELPGQLLGRLPVSSTPDIDALRSQASEHKSFPWLRPLGPSLTPLAASLVRTLQCHTDSVTAVAVTPDGRHVVSDSHDKTLRVWELATGDTKTTFQGHTSWVNAVAVTPDGRYVVSGSLDNTLRVWDLATGESKTAPQGHTDSVNAVEVTPDYNRVVSGSDDKTLRVWDLATGESKTALQGHTSDVRAVAVTPDGRHVVSGSDDNTLRVWDLASGKTIRTLQGHTRSINAVAVTPDGRYVVSGSDDKTLRVWDLASGKTKKTLRGHTSSVNAVAVTPDGRHVVSGSRDNTLRVWDLATGETKKTLRGHTSLVNAVAVTPDGRHVVSGSWDNTLRVWDLATGRTKRKLGIQVKKIDSPFSSLKGQAQQKPQSGQGHTGLVSAVAVTPDGRHVVSGSHDNTLRVWDLKDGKEILTFTVDGELTACGAALDNRTIVAGDGFGRLHFLQLVEADKSKPPIGDTKIQLLSNSG
jgi:WD40 repeat protein